jgi:hypothetical protein
MNTYFSPRKIIIAMLILTAIILSQILNLSEHTLNAQQSPQDELKVLWVKYGGEGDAYATCVIGSLVYVIGKYIGPPRGAIEARNINTGELVNSWENVYGSDTELYDCVVLGGYLYVIGIDNAPGNFEWLILKFTPKLELISEKHYNPSVMDDQALFINSDGRYLYVGGIDLAGGKNDAQWHLIKVDPRDLSIIKKYTYNPSTGWDEINSMAINPLDGKIWLVCVVNAYSLSERYWRIEVLDQDLSLVASKDIKDPLRKIVFDDVGYAYITSLNKIIKVSPDLHTMVNITFYHIPYKEVYSNGYFYFAINPADSTFGPFKHVLVRTTKNFDAEVKLTLSPEDNRDYYFTGIGKMVIADNRLFVAGVVADHGRKNWIIYSIALGPIQTYPTITLKKYSYFDEVFNALILLLEFLGIKDRALSGRFYVELEPIERVAQVKMELKLGYVTVDEFKGWTFPSKWETKTYQMKKVDSGFEAKFDISTWWPLNAFYVIGILIYSGIEGLQAELVKKAFLPKVRSHLTGNEPIYLTAEITKITVIDIDGNSFEFPINKKIKTAIEKWFEALPAEEKWMYSMVLSPVALSIVDPEGKRIGYFGGKLYKEIERAFVSPSDWTFQFILITSPKIGEYKIEVEGLENGEFSLYAGFVMNGKEVTHVIKEKESITKGTMKTFTLISQEIPPTISPTSPTIPTPSPTTPITTPTSPTQTLTTSPSAATPINIELIIIMIVIVATLASLVIVLRKYKAK